ncbi:MAG: amino acid adenylation domain protein [Steroidobacteraceae bacterium]|nr:amino acid adenylation domain protein [Steroidobacteraceae bacterium]
MLPTLTASEAVPLLPLQQGMALTLSAHPHAGIDVQQCFVQIAEPLDMPRLVGAWQAVMNRHEGLRTRFIVRGVEFFQHVVDSPEVDSTLIDWRSLTPAERAAAFETFLRKDRARGFDLAGCPLWRVTVFDCAADGFRFVFSHPHAIVDARSALNVLRDLFAWYADPEAALPPAGTFRDYMAWYARRDRGAAESCWRAVFEGFETTAPLLLPKPAIAAIGRASFEQVVDRELGRRIREVAEREKLPLSTVVKGAWAILLGRLSASTDVVFGEVRSGQRPEVPNMQRLVGMFVTTVPVRATLARELRFRALVHRLRELQNEVRDHEHTAIADIQKWCGLDSGAPLFESALVYDHMDLDEVLKREGDAWRQREIDYREHTAVPITVNVTALPDLRIRISWDSARFASGVMQRVPAYLQNLLAAFADDPDRTVSSMEMLGAAERERLLVTWNATDKPLDDCSCLSSAFEMAAGRYPERVAVTCDGTSLDFRTLARAVDRLAQQMAVLGVTRGSFVGLCVDRSIGMLVAMLATLKAGAAYVPLDPSFPDERLQFMVSDARPALLAVSARHADRFAAAGIRMLPVDDVPASARAEDRSPEASAGHLARSAQSGDIAYVIYTSGSSGRPKGVMLTHHNVLNCFAGMDDVLDVASYPRGTWLAVTSISFDISVIELLWTLTRGLAVTICRSSTDPLAIVKLLESRGITNLQCTPALARMLCHVPGALDALRRLRTLLLGGEALEQDLLETLGRPVVNVYGPTETAIWSTSAQLTQGDIHIGRPIANTRLYVLDASGAPVPTGVAGELYIGGSGVAFGYLNLPELSAERFVSDPFASRTGARMYRTGDLVRYREDGALEYLERADSQVKIRGHRIELGAIEVALRRLPQLADAAVIAHKDRKGEKRLVAYVTPAAGSNGSDHDALRAALATSLPDYEIPAIFIELPSLPLTPNLKVDRKALPDPERITHLQRTRQVIAPRNETERQIAKLWREVLAVEQISVTDNFFLLGGDSLRAVQVALGIRMSLGVELGADALHRAPTLEALALAITERSDEAPDAWATWETLGEGPSPAAVIGVHGVDRIFVELATHLGLRIDTVTSRVGFDGKAPPYHPARCVEDMADLYYQAIRERHPRGPYVLFGFCMGGLIATEVARRLSADGEQVSFLGLFNSPPPAARDDVGAKLARHTRALRALGVAGAARYLIAHSKGYVANLVQEMGRRYWPAPADPRALPVDAGDEAARVRRNVIEFGMRMVNQYRHRPYAGGVHLFHGAHWPDDYVDRWEIVAQGRVQNFLLPGGHLEMMEEPQVRAVAKCVRDLLGLPAAAPAAPLPAARGSGAAEGS